MFDKKLRLINRLNNPKIRIVGTYVNNHAKIETLCLVCQKYWLPTPNNLLHGHGCPVCAVRKKPQCSTLTHEQFLQRIDSSKISVIGVYEKTNKRITVECKQCGFKWKPKPNDLITGHGCPSCNKSSSTCEEIISKFFTGNHITFERQKKFPSCKNVRPLAFDFFLPERNVLIEYDGIYHFKMQKNRGRWRKLWLTARNDRIKNEWVRNSAYMLYRIPYTVSKNNIVPVLTNIIKGGSTIDDTLIICRNNA